jgi:hypothetical protein
VADAPEPQAFAFCVVPVAFGATVIVTEDTSTAAAGYFPVEESVTVTISDEPAIDEPTIPRFTNVLQTQLPSTGTGATAGPSAKLLSLFR